MSDHSQTTNAPSEPVLCKMGCGFFVSQSRTPHEGAKTAVLYRFVWFGRILQYRSSSLPGSGTIGEV